MRAVVFSTILAGCLSVPDGPAVECKVTSDCDTANGEVCEEGVCWGNPPVGPFAALITPPIERKNTVVSREVRLESLPADGYFGDLGLQEPVTFSGQVVCPNECTNASLAATIVVTRPSAFVGGPGFRQVFTSDPDTGTFQIVVPRVQPGEADYEITVVPDGRDQPGSAPAINELVPPFHTRLTLDKDQNGKTIDLGGGSPLGTVAGTIVDFQDNPAANYRVVALGRWEVGAPLTEVSTVDFIGQTGGNAFSIRISEGVVGAVEIVARAFGGSLQPTLHLTVNPIGALSGNHKLVVPDLGTASQPVTVVVQGTHTGGEVSGVAGAHVTVTGAIGTQTAVTEATFVAEGDTDMSGIVTLQVPGGDFKNTYRVSAIPPANSTVGVMFNQPVVIPGTTKLKLPDRLAIVGTVLDVDGHPLKDVQVTARPSLRFAWTLAPAPQTFVTAIPAASVVTPDTGEFVLFVDPVIDDGESDVFGFYDLEFDPTATTNAPSWFQRGIEVPRDVTLNQIALPASILPDAAHIHGRIVDPFGDLVPDAELKFFKIEDARAFEAFCGQLLNAPASCPIPAQLLGRGVSDKTGTTRLTLPRF